MRRFKNNAKKKAFTLVELLVVIAILAILAGVSVVGYLGFTEKANKSVDEQMCTQYNTLLKAQSVLDDDITLPDLVILIEENGINANKFSTLSKSYRFAYHPDSNGNNECVLIDKDSGEILFPEGRTYEPSELWASLPANKKLIPGVYNYALFDNVKLSELNGFNQPVHKFDLNHHLFRFDSAPTNKFEVKNGSVLTTSDTSNIVLGENTNKTDAAKTIEAASSANAGTLLAEKVPSHETATSVKLDGYNVFTQDNETDAITLSTMFPAATSIELTNCVFSNIDLENNDPTVDLVVKDCKFYNTEHFVMQISKYKSFTLQGCEVIDAKRGFNLGLSNGELNVINNTFDLIHVPTDKGEFKDTCIQFYFNHNLTHYMKDWETPTPTRLPNVKVNIKGNVVKDANAFLALHDSFIAGDETNVHTKKQYTALKTQLLNEEVFTITGNTFEKSTVKNSAIDPGIDDTLAKEAVTNAIIADENTVAQARADYDTAIAQLGSLVK